MSVWPEARPRRLVSRYVLSLPVRVRPAGLPSMSCEARNVGVGGLFLATDKALELSSQVLIAGALPDGRQAALSGRVVHVLSATRARELGAAPGVGVQFEGLGRQEHALVEELVAWARAHDPRPRFARRKPGADLRALQHEPMLGFVLGYLDGTRDAEALAQELALELDTIERMLVELERQGVIELSSSRPPSAAQRDKSVDPYVLLGVPAGSSRERPSMRPDGRMSIPPPAPGPADGSDELIDFRVDPPPSDASPTAQHKRPGDAHARARAAAAALRRPSVMPARSSPPTAARPTQPPADTPTQAPRSRATQSANAARSSIPARGPSVSLRPLPQSAAESGASADHTRPTVRPGAAAPTQPPPRSNRSGPAQARFASPGASQPTAADEDRASGGARSLRPPAEGEARGASGSAGPLHPPSGSARSLRPSGAGAARFASPGASQPTAAEEARASAGAGPTRPPARSLRPPAAGEARGASSGAGPTQPPAGAGRSSEAQAASPTQPPPSHARSARPSRGPGRSGRPGRHAVASQAEAAAQAAAEQAAAAAALSARGRPSQSPEASQSAKPAANEPSLGAAGQILTQAEAAYQAGNTPEASRHLRLLLAMTFDDPRLQARFAELKLKVMRTAAVDFEKQAAHEEKQQHWAQAARSWLRVVEGRPNDSAPLQRAALALLRAGTDLRTAMESAKRAVELAPNDAEAHRTLGKVYAAADMQASAKRELEAAQRCSGADPSEDGTPTALLKRLLKRDDGG